MYIIVYIYTHVTTYVLCFETDAKVVAAKHRQVSLTDGHMGVPQARWMVYDGKSKIFNGCELGIPPWIGNIHIDILLCNVVQISMSRYTLP